MHQMASISCQLTIGPVSAPVMGREYGVCGRPFIVTWSCPAKWPRLAGATYSPSQHVALAFFFSSFASIICPCGSIVHRCSAAVSEHFVSRRPAWMTELVAVKHS